MNFYLLGDFYILNFGASLACVPNASEALSWLVAATSVAAGHSHHWSFVL